MESDLRYFRRRAAAEMMAAKRSITPEARARHLELAEKYEAIVAAGEKAASVRERRKVAAGR